MGLRTGFPPPVCRGRMKEGAKASKFDDTIKAR